MAVKEVKPPFEYKGRLFLTYMEAARAYGLDSSIVKRRLQLGQPLEPKDFRRAVERKQLIELKMQKKPA